MAITPSRVSVLSDPFLPDSREEQGDFAGSHLGGGGEKRDEGKTFLGSAHYQIQLCGVAEWTDAAQEAGGRMCARWGEAGGAGFEETFRGDEEVISKHQHQGLTPTLGRHFCHTHSSAGTQCSEV